MSNAGFFYIVMPSSTKNYNMAIGITKSRQIWYISEVVCSESTVAQLTNIWHNHSSRTSDCHSVVMHILFYSSGKII